MNYFNWKPIMNVLNVFALWVSDQLNTGKLINDLIANMLP